MIIHTIYNKMSVYRLIVFSLKNSRNFHVFFIVKIDLDRLKGQEKISVSGQFFA